ncbi:mobilization protein [Nostoc sp. CHAB 5715]|uniref:mobilization protein n=1 Tax=Nostoc sp. CHAB 5715 TaxID=2780400 RepID=UPI001E307627|nr:mobilization protein [Nostoc sp. CHAB 5715]MCC5624461.1 mobilization protein [Nostoc sp. CHAB 5715]
MAEAILFGGDKGGCGKSMVCKTAIQYHLDKRLVFSCFDTDRSNADCYRCYSKVASFQLAVFSEAERLEDSANAIFNTAINQRTLINLPAQVFIPLKNWYEQNDLFEISQEAGVKFQLWHITDGGYDSLQILKKTLEYFQDKVKYVICKNYGRADDFEALNTDKTLQKLIEKYEAVTLDFPKLTGSIAKNRLDAQSLTFGEAITPNTNNFDLIEKSRIRKFLREAYAQFDTAGVFASAQQS